METTRPSGRPLAARLAGEDGFSLVEALVALGVMLGALLAMAYTAAAGFTDIAGARQRQSASALANKVLEQVRAVPYETVAKGLDTADLAGDPLIVLCGTDHYYRACPTDDPNAEKIEHATDLPQVTPIVPHVQTFGPPEQPTTYTVSTYVTEAKNIPATGGLRATVSVSWTTDRGTPGSIQAQTLLYRPSGSTDSSTAPQTGSSRPFFYGTGAVSRGSVVVTPNGGVTAGVGVQGLANWSSITHDLYSLDASIQQEQLAKSDGQITLTGGRKTEGSTETTTGSAKSVSVADDDPSTAAGTSSSPGTLTQTASPATLSGGGNALRAGGTGTLPPSCPPAVSTPAWLTGFEPGVAAASVDSVELTSSGSISADASVKRNGAYALKLERTSQSGNTAVLKLFGSTLPGTVVGRFAIRLSSTDLGNGGPAYLARVATGDGKDLRFGYQTSSTKFYMMIEGTGSWVTSSMTVAAGTWYVIDFRFTPGVSPRVIDWSVNGVTQAKVSVSVAASSGAYTQLGTHYGLDPPFVIHYDDVMVTTASSDYPIGDGKVLPLLPD
ncbi:MAG: hypothetical protein M3245_06665, partial [Actinomycetota bacterium]|nr:hypothetical protein [Actinomycetota bacterium]